MRLPNNRQLHEFCRVDGWESDRETGHTVYRKVLASSDVLTTEVSHGDKQIRNPGLFSYICREELQCTPEQFWEAVDRGVPVPRPQPEEPPAKEGLPYGLVQALRALGHSDDRIQQIANRVEAIALLSEGPTSA